MLPAKPNSDLKPSDPQNTLNPTVSPVAPAVPIAPGRDVPGTQVDRPKPPEPLFGSTDKDGVDVSDRPVGVMDLIATMTKSMGIGLDTSYTTPRGRPMKIVDGGKPIAELIG